MTFIPDSARNVQLESFNDNTTLTIDVGDASTDQYVAVDIALAEGANATSYRVLISSSPTGTSPVGSDILETESDNPVTTVTPQVSQTGTALQVDLVGSGPGNLVNVTYAIDRNLPR